MILNHCALLLLKGCAPHNWWRLLKLLPMQWRLSSKEERINASILKPVYTLYNLSLRIPVHMINLHLRIETGAIEYTFLCNNLRAKSSMNTCFARAFVYFIYCIWFFADFRSFDFRSYFLFIFVSFLLFDRFPETWGADSGENDSQIARKC